MSLPHPLAVPLTQLSNCRDQAFIDFDDPHPVLLDGSMYMKGQCDADGRNLRLWKYSIQSNTFSELMFPETCRSVSENDRHILTSFGSQLLLVHAQLSYPDPLPEPIYDMHGMLDYDYTYSDYIGEENLDIQRRTHRLNLKLYTLLKDNIWDGHGCHNLYSLKSPDPLDIVDPLYAQEGEYSEDHYYHKSDENRARDPMYWDVSAATSDDHLLVAFFRRDKYDEDEYDSIRENGYGPFINVKIVIFDRSGYNLHKCVDMLQFYCDSEDCKITKPFIFAHNDDVFVKVWSKAEVLDKFMNLKRASLKSLLDDDRPKWCDSHSIPESTNSNLTLLSNQVVITMSPNANPNDPSLYLCALTSHNSCNTWVEIAHFDYQFDPAPIIMGLSDGSKLVAIGTMKIHSQSVSNQELHVLQIVPRGKQLCASTLIEDGSQIIAAS